MQADAQGLSRIPLRECIKAESQRGADMVINWLLAWIRGPNRMKLPPSLRLD